MDCVTLTAKLQNNGIIDLMLNHNFKSVLQYDVTLNVACSVNLYYITYSLVQLNRQSYWTLVTLIFSVVSTFFKTKG